MEIFLVRHGKTNGNVSLRHQHINTPLNEDGVEQARLLVSKIREIAPTHVISSPNVRALETARIITEDLPDLIIDTNYAFRELEKPSYLTGNHFVTYTTIKYILHWFFGRPVSDGESYNDFLARLKEAKSHLESLPDNARVVVVTHSVFTIHFLHFIQKEKRMSLLGAMVHLLRVLTLKNTAVTEIELQKVEEGRKKKNRWCLGKC